MNSHGPSGPGGSRIGNGSTGGYAITQDGSAIIQDGYVITQGGSEVSKGGYTVSQGGRATTQQASEVYLSSLALSGNPQFRSLRISAQVS